MTKEVKVIEEKVELLKQEREVVADMLTEVSGQFATVKLNVKRLGLVKEALDEVISRYEVQLELPLED
jgi:hypothetical protein|tara:strand:- start:145 stop:348 length:204 start_codon:yes stop_codon:yes gene_type:complete